MKSKEVKAMLFSLGADLCGIAPVDRFENAPEGFHPLDVLPSCRSVVVFAKKFPAATLKCPTNVPYTITRNILTDKLDKMAVEFCAVLEGQGILAVPTGTISHNQYDGKTDRFRAIVSAKHSAEAAGLGRIGKNTLLTTPEYGNMVWLSVVLTDAALEPDDRLYGDPCPPGCSLCIDHCPAHALGRPEMDQGACYDHAFRTEAGQELTIKCHLCRSICPNCLGSENGR